MKSNSPEEPRIAENKSTFDLVQDEVVVFIGAKPRRLCPQFSSHAEMDADPIAAGKFEQHLFSPRE
jgi:hypothetical protein